MNPAPTLNASNAAPPKSWWSRNWKWFVPVGCLSLTLLVAGGVFAIVALVFGLIKSSDIYKDTVAQAKTNPAIVTLLGTPIEDSWYVMGQIKLKDDSGHADLQIPLSGPKGEGTLHVAGTKSAGVWTTAVLRFQLKGAPKPIDLLKTDADPDATEPEAGDEETQDEATE
jgi:hypothetical protein